MKLTYDAYERDGKSTSGVIEAATAEDARKQLEARGLYISRLGGEEERGGKRQKLGERMPGGRRLKNLSIFTRQLAVLVATGTPVVDALRALEKQSRDPVWSAAVRDIRIRVEEGETLSAAMASHPKLFDPVARSLVSAGETGGCLDQMLNRLAALTRQQQKTRSMLLGAMVYPGLLLTVSSSVLVLMLVFVLPRFTELFESLDAPLPPSTEALMVVSEIVRGYWWAVVPSIFLLVGGIVFSLRSEKGKVATDHAVLRMPWVGPVAKNFLTARFARLLGMLLESKVPMLEALELVRAGTTNAPYGVLLDKANDAVVHGEPLSAVLASTDIVSGSVVEAVRNAENSGTVGPVLSNLADFMDEDNEIVVRSLSSIVEPLILIVLGVVVGFVALSMFLPLFDLTSMTGPGGPAPSAMVGWGVLR